MPLRLAFLAQQGFGSRGLLKNTLNNLWDLVWNFRRLGLGVV